MWVIVFILVKTCTYDDKVYEGSLPCVHINKSVRLNTHNEYILYNFTYQAVSVLGFNPIEWTAFVNLIPVTEQWMAVTQDSDQDTTAASGSTVRSAWVGLIGL